MKPAAGRRPKKPEQVREEAADYGDAIALYHAPDGTVSLDVRLQAETLWLDAHQMALLFGRDRSVIVRHIRNIYATNELDESATCAKNAQVAADGKARKMNLYNLDVIISVGYRVNSKRGTQFRIWATQVLRDHILKGYSVNERRLKELRQSIRLAGQVLDRHDVSTDEAKALLRVVADYERALDVLDDYDHQRVRAPRLPRGEAVGIGYDEARRAIEQMRKKFGGSALFGQEKDDSLRGSLGAILQTVGGRDAYPSLEEKAANLLYFLVKNHSFVDGNKRIAAALFLWFLEKNRMLYGPDGAKRLANATLVALTLMLAESQPDQKEVLTRLIANLIHAKD